MNGHETTFIRCGEGSPLVLLHGYDGAMWIWEHQIEALRKRFTVFIPDLIGHGRSEKPRITYTPVTYLNWLEGFMNAVGIERPDFVGNSMGCGLIMAMAMTRPERVGRMVLISGFPAQVLNRRGGTHLRRFLRLHMGFLFSLAYRLLSRRALRTILRRIVYDPAQITSGVTERAYRLHKDYGKAWPLWSSLCHLHEWEQQYAPDISQVTAPALVLWGQNDGFFPPDVGEELHRSIPGSRFALIPHAGHLPMWEQPDWVNRLILDFLGS